MSFGHPSGQPIKRNTMEQAMTIADAQSPSFSPRATVRASARDATQPSKAARRTSFVLSFLALAFLLVDAGGKLLQITPAVEGTRELGWNPGVLFSLGVVQLVCWALYVIPRTAVLGALLWTGYLGGAVATHVRIDNPLFSHVLFPVYVALLLWGGLWLRLPALRALLPLRRS
jgi:hypothetical protein